MYPRGGSGSRKLRGEYDNEHIEYYGDDVLIRETRQIRESIPSGIKTCNCFLPDTGPESPSKESSCHKSECSLPHALLPARMVPEGSCTLHALICANRPKCPVLKYRQRLPCWPTFPQPNDDAASNPPPRLYSNMVCSNLADNLRQYPVTNVQSVHGG